MAHDEVMQIRISGEAKAEIEQCAAELDVTISQWVRDACESYRVLSQPTLRYLHDIDQVPNHLRAAWEAEHGSDPKYRRPMP